MQQLSGENWREEGHDIRTELLQVIQGLIAELRPDQMASQPVTLDSELMRDLGLDSLARVELLSRIEQHFAVTLPERVFVEAETPRDLLRAILSSGTQIKLSLTPETSRLSLGEVEAVPHGTNTLIEVLQWHVKTHPDRPHIRFYSHDNEGEILTYQQLWTGAEKLAAELQAYGLQTGDAVAIMLPTGSSYFFSFFGILLSGGIPVPIYPPVRSSQLEEHLRRHASILSNCLATILITVPEARRVAQLLKSQVDTLRSIITVDELSAEPSTFSMPVRGAQDIAFLQYTSGSTGNPKGLVLTHANLLANIRAMGDTIRVDSSDVFVSWLPLYHDMGLISAWLGSLYYAALFVVMSPLEFLARPYTWLWAIHRYGGTLSAAPNFGYELCLHRIKDIHIEGLNLGTWRAAFNGAEAVSPDTMLRFYDRFHQYGLRKETLKPVYGLAECSVGLAFPPNGREMIIDKIQRETFVRSGRAIPVEQTDPKALRFVACGQALQGHQIRIIDPTGIELPDRQEGYIQFRGPSATSGYFRNPAETSRLFDGEWLNTGDLGYMSGGDVFITGRSKDVIIRAGRNIYPDELEEAVGDIDGVRKGRVTAFASSDPGSGTERLVLIAETRLQDPEMLERLRHQINVIATDLVEAPPDDLVLAPPNSVLKTSSGKLRRAASRELYEQGKIGKAQKTILLQVFHVTLAGLRPQMRHFRQALVTRLYGIYARILFWILAPLVWLAAATLPPVDWRWAAIRAGARLLAKATGTPLKVQGQEHLPPSGQPCVFVANHASYLDGPVLVAAFNRQFSFVAKAELLKRLIPRVFLSRIQAEFVERFDQQKGIIDAQRLAMAAQHGRSLVFFPEGTFTRVSGLLPFHMGAFVAAAEAGLPVVPIIIRGTRSILRARDWFPHQGTITVTFGEPIYPDKIKEQVTENTWTIALKLRNASREIILRHCGEPDLANETQPI
ncbi:MAG: acyl-phosphate glycerol 3-phosphate acyltransferase [Gammaproteobacteria bacterium]|nr:MAG: acyl-phosphate glycerol 3-phosphate acyltransferase [Gammaproteobacteria bacterium]